MAQSQWSCDAVRLFESIAHLFMLFRFHDHGQLFLVFFSYKIWFIYSASISNRQPDQRHWIEFGLIMALNYFYQPFHVCKFANPHNDHLKMFRQRSCKIIKTRQVNLRIICARNNMQYVRVIAINLMWCHSLSHSLFSLSAFLVGYRASH